MTEGLRDVKVEHGPDIIGDALQVTLTTTNGALKEAASLWSHEPLGECNEQPVDQVTEYNLLVGLLYFPQ